MAQGWTSRVTTNLQGQTEQLKGKLGLQGTAVSSTPPTPAHLQLTVPSEPLYTLLNSLTCLTGSEHCNRPEHNRHQDWL